MNLDFYRIYIVYFLIFLLALYTLFLSLRIEKTNLSDGDVVFIDGKTYRLVLAVNEDRCNFYHLKETK